MSETRFSFCEERRRRRSRAPCARTKPRKLGDGRAGSAPASSHPSHRLDTSASTARCKTPPPKGLLRTRQVVLSIDVSHTAGSDRSGDRMGAMEKFSAKIGVLLVPGVVVPHPLGISHDRCVVTRNLQMFGERVRPLRRRHHPARPLTVVRDEQQRGLGHRGLRLDERLHAAPSLSELGEMRGNRVIDRAALRGVSATPLHACRGASKPAHGIKYGPSAGDLPVGAIGCRAQPDRMTAWQRTTC
jgi:hypothetical protein